MVVLFLMSSKASSHRQVKGILQEISAELKFCFVHIFNSAHPTLCISFVIIFLSEDIS